ncbi:amidase family protein [Penicillium malachiteum]|nr:amidase family protein [Penicillium malachiteum]
MDGAPVKNLAELVAFNEAHESQAFAKGMNSVITIENNGILTMRHVGFEGQDFLKEALRTNLIESQYHDLIAKTYDMAVVRGIENALEKNQLDFLLTPGWNWMSIYSAWAKSPVGTVPLGTHSTGRPFGLGFVGRRFEDNKMLQVMNLYEKTFHPRQIPERMRWKRHDRILPAQYRGYF